MEVGGGGVNPDVNVFRVKNFIKFPLVLVQIFLKITGYSLTPV
jgi:hypothetical protein